MAQNPFASYDPAVQAYLNQALSGRQYMTAGGTDGASWSQAINQMQANNSRIAAMQKDIEWANQQRMTDPSYWMQVFGMGSGSGGGGVGAPQYQDTAAQYRTRLNTLMDNPDSIANTGAYKFAFNQGNEAVNRNLAAKGLLKSGNRLAELTKFGQGLASQQYGAEFDRMSNLVNTTRAGDISKYGADANLYGTELQGRNQLRALLMKNILDNQQKPTQYGVGRSSGGGASAQTYDPTANLANPGGMWTMNQNSYDPITRQGMYTNSLTGQQQMRSGW